MTPPLAGIADLERRLGSAVTAHDQVLARLEDASAIVRAYAGATWLDDDGNLDGVPDEIVGVVANMVERATRNPDGATQEGAGPFQRSFAPVVAQRLFLTAHEKMVVRHTVGRSSISTMTTTRGPIETARLLGTPADDLPTEVPW